jgi:hypothetical protein
MVTACLCALAEGREFSRPEEAERRRPSLAISDYYAKHVVAFVDILGFSELVQRMDQDPSIIDSVYGILSQVDKEDVSAFFGDWVREGLANLTVASDSIFFSIALDAWSRSSPHKDVGWACLATLESVFWLQRYLLKRGILTRGGVALGSLLHHNNVIFGPALVRAYRLESQLALFPRVIVDPPVLENIAIRESAHVQFPFRLASLTRRDMDGLTHIDYLHFDAMSIENEPRMVSLFGELRHAIVAALTAARSDTKVFQKVAWLANYFNESLGRMVTEGIRGLSNVETIELGAP